MPSKRFGAFFIFALLALGVAVFASSGTEAGTYKVRTTYQIVNPAAGAVSDTSMSFTIPAPDYNYEDSSMFSFAPVDGWIAMGSSIPIGAGMGVLYSSSTLGLFNGKCSTPVWPLFNLYNATVDTSKVLGRDLMAWTNTARPISYRYQCSNNTDDDGDTKINDGCPKEASNDDAPDDTVINDGCPAVGAAEMLCADDVDNDGDGTTNDGCPLVGAVAETGTQCDPDAGEATCGEASCPDADSTPGYPPWATCDDDGDTMINDGCAAVGTAEVSSDITLPDYLEYYPYFLNSMLDPPDPDGGGPLPDPPPLKPRARYAGHTLVAGTSTLTQIIVLNPGQITQLPGIKAQMVAGLGYVMITVLNNPWDQVKMPWSISDSCTPLSLTTTLFGTTTDNPATAANEAGYVSQQNQAATSGVLGTGTLMSRTYSMSERDADGDGWENDLDPCPYTLDPLWDPRVSCVLPGPGDQDCDGLPNSCDPAPTTFNWDQDGDGYLNRQDICPLVKNGQAVGEDNQADTDSTVQALNADLGPGPDSIGDACDDSDDDDNEDGGAAGDCNDGIDNGPDGTVDGNDPDCIASAANGWTGMDKGEIAHGNTPAQIWGTTPGTGLFWHSLPWAATCIGGAETGTQCTAGNLLDEDSDLRFNDGCPAVGAPETVCNETACPNLAACDNDSDGSANDGCPGVIGSLDADGDGYCDALENLLGSPPNNGPETGAQCTDAEDPSCVNSLNDDMADDGGALWGINDGCPAKGAAETACDDAVDDDADTRVNDGCPAVNNPENPACANDTDDDADTVVNDGCPAKGAAETACADAVDDDGDTNVNDGCPVIGTDDDADTYVNDGCPMKGSYAEVGAQCANAVSDDTPTPDTAEATLLYGPYINDGCPVIGVPESLVIDPTAINAPAALPSASPPASCSDGVDNDGDTTVDTDNQALGCNPAHPSYTGDTDLDGVKDVGDAGGDNCPTIWNPEQTNTDVALWAAGASVTGDALGDPCDADDDNDGFTDALEWYFGTDPLDNCTDGPGDDAWPLDMNMDRYVGPVGDVALYSGNVGLLDTDPGWSAALQRLDLSADGAISAVSDVWRFYHGMIGEQCDGGTPTPHSPPVSEGAPVTMGIDPEVTGNSASTLGNLEACVRIDVDAEDFGDGVADHTIDVYVTDAAELSPTGYDAWLVYDPGRVDPVSWNDLIKLPGASGFTGKREDVSRLNAGAAYMSGGPGIGGNGTIVRIDLDVKSAGPACFGFGLAKAYSSVDVIHPTVVQAASLSINTDCATGDSEGDTIIDMCDNCRGVSNPGQEDFDGDGWGDACDNCPTTPTPWYVPPGDDDCDGFTTAVEEHIGTDPLDACPDVLGADDAWPLDINMDTYATVVGDVDAYSGRIGAHGPPNPSPEWSQRLDINMDNYITVVGDVSLFSGLMGFQCA